MARYFELMDDKQSTSRWPLLVSEDLKQAMDAEGMTGTRFVDV
ncbi:hypothetical protein [Cystobacter fuscus]|nr:hypothetical protein [Cystobacter fuscus]